MSAPAENDAVPQAGAKSTAATPRTRESRLRRRPRWLPRVLLESLLIVFSVMLALAVDQWRDNRSRAARARLALDAIINELESNREAIDRAAAFHEEIAGKLKAIAASGELPSREVAFGGIFQPANLIATAWTSARDTGAAEQWPYDLVLRISRVYERQASYNELRRNVTSDIYVDMRRRGAEAVLREGYAGFITLASDFANRERALRSQCDELLALLRAERP
jgi:hypothetical protein